MRVYLFCFFLLFSTSEVYSQSALPKNTADSLWNIWSNQLEQDTIRVVAIRRYIWEGYLFSQPDSAFHFANLQYNFSIKKGLKKQQADALNTQGISYSIRNNPDLAIDYYLKSLKIREEILDNDGAISTLRNLSKAYSALGESEKALDAINRSILLCEVSNNSLLASTLHDAGEILYKLRRLDGAILFYRRSLAIYKTTGNKKGQAASLYGIAEVYNFQGDYSKSITFYTASLNLSKEIGDVRTEAISISRLGTAYWNKGDFVPALEYYEQALNYSIEFDDQFRIGIGLNNIGNVYWSQGDYDHAIEYYSKSLKICEEINDEIGVSIALNNIGVIYRNQKKYPEALEYYNRSLKIVETGNDKYSIGNYLSNIGVAYAGLKQFDTALIYFNRSLEIRREIADQKGIAIVMSNIGSVYEEMGLYENAIQYQKNAIKIAIELGLPDQIILAYSSLVTIYSRKGELDDAKFNLHLLIAQLQNDLEKNYFTLPENQKELYFTTMEKDFGLFYDFTFLNHTSYADLSDTAYNLTLQNKGITLKSSSAMRSAVLNSGDSLLISDYENWILLKEKITDGYAKGQDTKILDEEANKLEKNLVKKSNGFSEYNKMKNLNWKDVQASLKTGECAIEFVNFVSKIDTMNPTIYMALLIKPESIHPQVIQLCTESDLIKILRTFQGTNLNFVNKQYGTKTDPRTALYEKIWQPLEPFLENTKTVYYSPSGLLHKISFAAISKSQNVFLSDLYNFRQMGSTGTLVLTDNVALGEIESFMLMGGVNYNSDSTSKEVWSYLPGSLQETDAINAFLLKKKFSTNYFRAHDASENIFKDKITGSSIVHIATHGFFFADPEQVKEEMKADEIESDENLKFRSTANYANWSFVSNKNPLMRSGIVLANANDVWQRNPLAEGEDGILTAQEVSNLDLRNTKLVVLSACETGLGDIKGSEGVFGLQRAFKMAGVNYLIMSLWQVPDKETSEFMILFYKNLIKLKDIPKAFQKTQKMMREKYDPYYWGAFVLIE